MVIVLFSIFKSEWQTVSERYCPQYEAYRGRHVQQTVKGWSRVREQYGEEAMRGSSSSKVTLLTKAFYAPFARFLERNQHIHLFLNHIQTSYTIKNMLQVSSYLWLSNY